MPDSPSNALDKARTPLLSRIVEESMDEDYVELAVRRSESAVPAPAPQTRRSSLAVAGAVLALFGVMVGVLVVQTDRNAPAAEDGRESLIAEIHQERDGLEAQQREITDLQQENTRSGNRLSSLADEDRATGNRLDRMRARTGYAEVSGPGVRVLLDDAEGGDVSQVVRDEDLAMLADGFWSAGATAISVNGQRLTSLSSFRNVGPAIHVNRQPLSPPYRISVLGDTDTLQGGFADSSHGAAFNVLAGALGFEFTMQNEDSLTLPAAILRPLRNVVEMPTDQPSPAMEVAP